MKWNHLPLAGGIYDQHPGLIDRFYYLFAERNKEEMRKEKREKRNSPSKVAGRR